MLVVTVVLVLGACIPLMVFAKPLIAVIPVPLAAPKPIIFPLMVAEPALPGDTRMPLYRNPVVVKARGAVW